MIDMATNLPTEAEVQVEEEANTAAAAVEEVVVVEAASEEEEVVEVAVAVETPWDN